MQVRLVRYFLTLVKERHFARAADICGVSQPTLSAGIGALERQLGKRLVVRDRRFISLTPEGEALLPWARQMIAAQEGMTSALAATHGEVSGQFRLGVIPAALPLTGQMGEALLASRPGLALSVRSLTSREIVRALSEYEIDGGLTYLDHEPPADVLSVPLYAEEYRLLIGTGSIGNRADQDSISPSEISLSELAELPLCLLHQGMQNRRILDARMAEHGIALHPRITADSYVALFSMVRAGSCATIIPDSYATLFPDLHWARSLPFRESVTASRIGLIVLDRTPLTPLAHAAIEAARSLA
ncbi:MAG: LysR family transcriptional regulator [Sphingobium sp.]